MVVCSRCGSASEEQASFCWHCGRALAGPFTQFLRGRSAARSIERTAHFELQMPTDSFAVRRARDIGASLELLRDAIGRLLALTDAQLAGPYRVYLGDILAPPADGSSDESASSWIDVERDAVWAIYRPDAPGIELPRAVVRLLVLRGAGFDLATLPAIWLGLVRLCDAPLQREPLEPELSRSLVATFGRRAPSLSRLLDREQQPDGAEAAAVAVSLLAFLLERAGPQQLCAYLAAAAAGSPAQAAGSVYKTALPRLEKDWWAFVRRRAATGTGGIVRFLIRSLRY